MQRQHLLVKVQGRRCTCHGGVKVTQVTSGFLDVTRGAIGVKHTMTGHHCSRMQGLDVIQRAEPLAPGVFIGAAMGFNEKGTGKRSTSHATSSTFAQNTRVQWEPAIVRHCEPQRGLSRICGKASATFSASERQVLPQGW
jgi:hypothetical protein